MKYIMCICNTFLQIIIAIAMKETLFESDVMTIVITDHSNDAEQVALNLKKENLFNDVIFEKVKELDKEKHGLLQGASTIMSIVSGRDSKRFNYTKNKYFDLLLFYNQSVFVSLLYANLYEMNPDIQVARFEEGVISYSNRMLACKRQDIGYKLRRKLHKKNISESLNQFYCTYPEYYDGALKVEKIPTNCLYDPKVVDLIKRVFLGKRTIIPYRQTYIYFSSVYDFEGETPINELKLIETIASVVGKENLIVKVHPRDNMERFRNQGLIIDPNSNVPWEAIQFGMDFSEHIFLTVNSTSVLTVNMLLEKPAETYFLYPMCDIQDNSIASQTVQSLESLFIGHGLYKDMKWLHISDNIKEILS
ncbi:MAG: alpha-2,8-polysialyltransferase family protein [Lachnospiraceae bacterium]